MTVRHAGDEWSGVECAKTTREVINPFKSSSTLCTCPPLSPPLPSYLLISISCSGSPSTPSLRRSAPLYLCSTRHSFILPFALPRALRLRSSSISLTHSSLPPPAEPLFPLTSPHRGSQNAPGRCCQAQGRARTLSRSLSLVTVCIAIPYMYHTL